MLYFRPIGQAASVRRVTSVVLAIALAVGMTPVAAPGRAAAVTFGSPGPLVYANTNADGAEQLWTAMPGGEPVPIPGTLGTRAARWSPDGRVIAFQVFGDGIFLINPDGSGRRQIAVASEETRFGEPIWSADGTSIAYALITLGVTGDTYEIEIIDSVSGTPTRIPSGLHAVADWLEDGTFVGSAWRYEVPGLPARNQELAIQTPDGTTTFLTETPTRWESAPRVSPDGQRLAYVTTAGQPDITYELGVMDIDGGNVRYMPLGTQLAWPAWSPNGTEIAFGPFPSAVRADDFTGVRPLINGRGSGDGMDWAPLAGTIPDPPPIEGIRTAALKDPSTRTNTTVAATSIWPTVDGYRDTVGITQRLYEPARATLSIYGPTGALVRRIAYKFDTGVATYTWNGRSSTGAILAAGRYRLVTTSKDLAGNTKVLTRYVTLYRGRH